VNQNIRKAVCLLIGVFLALVTILPVGEAVYSARIAYDPDLGTRVFWPGKQVVWRWEGNGCSLWSEHNIRRQCLPSSEEKPVILVFGDSMTQALQVDDTDIYTKRLEGALLESGARAAVLNAGVGGGSLADYVARARAYQRLFSPDWVVVQITWTDFQEALETSRAVHFQRNGNNSSLEVVSPPPSRPGRAYRFFAALPEALTDRLTFAYPASRVSEFAKWVEREPPLFHAPPPQVAMNKSDQNADLLISEQLDLLKETWHGRLTLLLLTAYNPLGPAELRPDEKEIDALAREKGISIVRLDEGFSQLPPGISPYGFDNLGGYNTGHMNPCGHQLVADLLAAELNRIASTNGLY
jgi:hypothetical protein